MPAAPLWNGFYFGVNGGYGWSAKGSSVSAYANDEPANVNVIPGANTGYFNRNGGFGGGQLGYNVQRDYLLLGIETDLQGSALSGRRSAIATSQGTEPPPYTGNAIAMARAQSSLEYFGTVRGRIGVAADRTLFYFTGGLAYGGVKDGLAANITDTPQWASPYGHAVTKEETRTGYVAGGGVEYAFTPSLSLKAEYQYLDLGKVRFDDGHVLDNSAVGRTSLLTDHSYHTVRIGLNYRLQQDYAPLK